MFMKLILFLFLFYYTTILYSQSSIFKHYSVNDGLPNSEVYHVFQDSKRFIWIATNYGVSRFDGYKFTNYTTHEGLPDNTVLEIYEDFKGRIWFLPLSCKFSYFENGKIIKCKFNAEIRLNLKSSTIPAKFTFHIDSAETIIFGTLRDGVLQINKKGIISKPFCNCKENDATFQINKTANQVLTYRCPNNTNLVKWKDNKGILKIISGKNSTFFKDYKLTDLKNGGLFFSTIDKFDNIILTQGRLLYKINGTIKRKIFQEKIICLYKTKNGELWVGTPKCGAYNFENGDIFSPPNKNFLKGKSISSILEDNDGGIWFSTLEDGIFYMPSKNFLSYTIEEGLNDNKVISTINGKSSMMILSAGNTIVFYDSKLHTLSNIHLSSKNSIITNAGIYYPPDNTFYVATDESIYRISGENVKKIDSNIPTIYKYNEKEFSAKSLCLSYDGSIWIGTSYGLLRMRNDKVIYNSIFPNQFQSRINTLFEATDHTLWIGSTSGLWIYKNDNFEDMGKKYPSLSVKISDITNYKDWMIICTRDSGIFFYKNNQICNLSTANGLSSNFITKALVDKNTLWIGTNNGLNKVDLQRLAQNEFTMSIVTTKHGLISNEINHVNLFSHSIYVSTNNGLTFFNPIKQKRNKNSPKIYIENIKILKQDTILKSLYDLPHDKNMISIDFIGLCYKNTTNTNYRYKMVGLNNEWTYTKFTKADYAFLPSGKYTFYVYAQNEDGIWSSKPATVSFIINPPFWRKWWFIVLCVIAIITILWLAYHIRIKELKKRHKLKDELNRYMQLALTKQMNPHFIFNSLNSIQNYILENDKRESTKYLSKFSKLMRIVLDNSQKPTVTLEQELNALNLYLELEALRFTGKFEYAINIDESIDQDIQIPSLLIQPYVENAIWHGIMHKPEKYGKVIIDFIKDTNYIRCIITDDGIGRQKSFEINANRAKTHKSYGMSITEKRLQIFNSLYNTKVNITYTDLKDIEGNPCGTSVELKIVIPKD